MSLNRRKQIFKNLSEQCGATLSSPVNAVGTIPPHHLEKIRTCAAQMVAGSLPEPAQSFDHDHVFSELCRQRDRVRNITPNGLVVPKRQLIPEYNLLVKTFVDFVSSLGFSDMIEFWGNVNLRLKDSNVVEANVGRPHATEKPHTDAWAGELPNSIHLILPLWGDVQNNNIQYYIPPDDFQESWMMPLEDFDLGAELTQKYSMLDQDFTLGKFFLADFSTLHASRRRPGAGPRVSIDIIFSLKRDLYDDDLYHNTLKSREEQRVTHAKMETIGKETLFVFNKRIEDPFGNDIYTHSAQKELVTLVKPDGSGK